MAVQIRHLLRKGEEQLTTPPESDPPISASRDNDVARIRELVKQIDCLLPRDDAWLELSQYGGDQSESCMTGNHLGYQRFGIEFLKASLKPNVTDSLEPDLEQLLCSTSTVNFHWYTVSDVRPEEATQNDGCAKVALFGFALGLLTLVILAAIGLIVVAKEVFGV